MQLRMHAHMLFVFYECVFVHVLSVCGNICLCSDSESYHAPRNSVKQTSQGELRLEINTDQDPLFSFHMVCFTGNGVN